MNDNSMSGMGWFPILFVVIVIWAIFGGGLGINRGNYGYNDYGCNRVSNCEVEKQEIIDSARTQYMIEQQGSATRAATEAGVERIYDQNIRLYIQDQSEKMFDLKMENASLKNSIFTKEQTDAISAKISECCCAFNRRLDSVENRMLTKPQLSGVATTCNGQIVPSPAGGWFNGYNGYGYGYGTVIQ